MKLTELFDREPEDTPSDETSLQDMILTRFELGQLTYDQAWEEIVKVTPKDELYFWRMELISADQMKKTPDEISADHLQRNASRTLQ